MCVARAVACDLHVSYATFIGRLVVSAQRKANALKFNKNYIINFTALLKLSKMYCMRPKYAGVNIASRHPMADRWREGAEGLVTPPAPGGVDKDCHHDADGYDASPRHGAG